MKMRHDTPIPTISARELHRLLAVQEPFEAWILQHIRDGGWQEGRDYWTVMPERPQGDPQ